MIRFIKGIFHPGLGGEVIVESPSGLGFEIAISANSPLYKKMEGEEVKVFTSMIVKEDDVSLYGFADKESLELFELLITVNGVGAAEICCTETLNAEINGAGTVQYQGAPELTKTINGLGTVSEIPDNTK